MRPCRDCGYPLPNNSSECPECHELEERRKATLVSLPDKHKKPQSKKHSESRQKVHEDTDDLDGLHIALWLIAALFFIPLVILVRFSASRG